MMIGDGVLNLGMLGVNRENIDRIMSITELSELAREALSYPPLKKIFSVSGVETRTFPVGSDFFEELERFGDDFTKTYNPSMIAVVGSWERTCYGQTKKRIYLKGLNPAHFVHELGHSLGLMHPCGYNGCENNRGDREGCSLSDDIMSCGANFGIAGFSNKDLKFLRSYVK